MLGIFRYYSVFAAKKRLIQYIAMTQYKIDIYRIELNEYTSVLVFIDHQHTKDYKGIVME